MIKCKNNIAKRKSQIIKKANRGGRGKFVMIMMPYNNSNIQKRKLKIYSVKLEI